VLAILALAVVAMRRGPRRARLTQAFGDYLTLTCLLLGLAFAGRQMDYDTMLVRYLFVLSLLPAALATVVIASTRNRVLRGATMLALVWLAGFNALANAGYYRALRVAHIPDRLGMVATFVDRRGYTSGLAPYWTAYNLTFRTGGRVHVASSDVVRIPEYREEYDARADQSFRIDTGPCKPGGEVVLRGITVCTP